jgi:hypothetical protein
MLYDMIGDSSPKEKKKNQVGSLWPPRGVGQIGLRGFAKKGILK